MRALVTGASGFVASALCRALVREGHQVVGLTRDPARAKPRVGTGVTLLEGGVGDPRKVAQAAAGCELLFHAAGIASLEAPARVLRWVHVAGTENVLNAARHAGLDRVVHISCADVTLTDEDRMHWDEKRVLARPPLGPHAQTTLMAEELALSASDDDLEVTALRPALLWGPDDVDGVAGLARAVGDGSFALYGGGRNVLATTHIDNLVKAALRAATAPAAPGRAYYVTDGEFLEARELYKQLFDALGLPGPKLDGQLGLSLAKAKLRELVGGDQGAARAVVMRRARSALFDVSRAIHDLGYEPKIDLAGALDQLATWVKAQGGIHEIAKKARPQPTERDVDDQVSAAGGD